jgi:hypothetical protein
MSAASDGGAGALGAAAAAAIPDRYLFVWDDNFLPYYVYLAVKSVAAQCRPARIDFFKTPALDGVPNFQRLVREVECLNPIDIDLAGWLERAGLGCGPQLLEANGFLKARNYYGSVSDLLRALGLYLDGGIYLDTDTLTLRDLAPLRAAGGFVAEEHILVSSAVYRRNSRWRYFRTVPLTAARAICAQLPFGVWLFRSLRRFYVRAVHNAVMGFRPRHPLMRDVLERIAERYPQRPLRYPLLGPDTVQDLLDERRYDDVVVHPPDVFSPLGPTMTMQYFTSRRPRTIDRVARQVVRPDTFAIHWSSNGTIKRIVAQDDDQLAAMAGQQLFARLAMRAVRAAGDAAAAAP